MRHRTSINTIVGQYIERTGGQPRLDQFNINRFRKGLQLNEPSGLLAGIPKERCLEPDNWHDRCLSQGTQNVREGRIVIFF